MNNNDVMTLVYLLLLILGIFSVALELNGVGNEKDRRDD